MNEIELKIVIGLHRNANSLDKNTNRIISKKKLSIGQFAVLEALYNKGDMSIGMVRDKILSSVGTIPVIVNNLEKRGYITRREDEKDRRISILSLTSEGREMIRELIPHNTRMIKEYMDVLTEEEKEKLLELLKKIGKR